MSLSADDIIRVMERAKELGFKSVEVEGIKADLNAPAVNLNGPSASDIEAAEQALTSPLDDYTDEEIRYYHTPYFDVLQEQKKEKAIRLQEEKDLRNG